MTRSLPPTPALGEPLPQEPAPEVLAFLARRRSVSALTLIGPGPSRDAIAQMIRVAARAPDHGKLAPWRFVVASGGAKAALCDRLTALADRKGEGNLATKVGKLRTPPAAVLVISSPKTGAIPEWEQHLSAGAVCANLLNAALAMGFGANWITDWYAYDPDAKTILGLEPNERMAGVLLLGSISEPPLERERPDPGHLTRWL